MTVLSDDYISIYYDEDHGTVMCKTTGEIYEIPPEEAFIRLRLFNGDILCTEIFTERMFICTVNHLQKSYDLLCEMGTCDDRAQVTQIYDGRLLLYGCGSVTIHTVDYELYDSWHYPMADWPCLIQLHDGRLALDTGECLYIYTLKGQLQASIQHSPCVPSLKQLNGDTIMYMDNMGTQIVPILHYIPSYGRLDRLNDISFRHH